MNNPSKYTALLLAAGILLTVAGCASAPRSKELTQWPAGQSPAEIGKRVAENFAARKFQWQEEPRRQFVIYPEVCAWYGALTFAQLTGDKDLQERMVRKYDVLLTTEGSRRVSKQYHVDYHVFGVVPLEIYMQTKDAKFLEFGRDFADKQWANPSADGITREARYWIDDMYMIPAVQVQAFRATGDAKYLDRAALTMAAYLDKLQQPNGLFFHASDSPFYWSRGNGWFAAGMAELLRSLPKDHPKRARIMEGYRKMMASLLKFQTEDGLWRQLVDQPDFWPETSGAGMFAFAMVTGVKNSWLDAKEYAPAARKAWLGLVKHINKDANVDEICSGTNKAAQVVGSNKDTQRKFYLERERKVGDLHGQAPILWTASALLRE